MPNTSYQTNPLLVTPATPLVVPTPAVVSGDTPGAMQMTTGAQASMVPPTVTPVVPGSTPEPTVGQTLGTINSTAASNANPTINEQVAAANAPKVYSPVTLGTNNIQDPTLNPIDEKAITRNQMKLFQAEIDATNKVYDQLYNQKVLEGTGRLGTQRAQAARGGLLGSDFGTAQQEKVMSYNTAEQQAVQAERQAKIGAIMGKVRTAVADEIAAKRLARTQDADAYLKYLNGRDETRKKNTQTIAESFLSQGIDPTTLTPDEMKAITGDSGISAADIIMSYQTAKSTREEAALKGVKTQAEIDKLNADTANSGLRTLSEGQSLIDNTGKVIASKAKTYAPGTGSDTSVKLTSEDKRTLLGGGWSEADIAGIENDVRSSGLTAVIENAKANGATTSQIAALNKAYGSATNSNQFLTTDYFSKLFTTDQLAKAANDAGFTTSTWGGLSSEPDTTAYLAHIQSTIEAYRQAGYTDQEILKMMQ